MHPEDPFPRPPNRFSPTFVPACNRKRARSEGPSPTPINLFAMEFLNKIELRGIVGQSSLNRVGDSQAGRVRTFRFTMADGAERSGWEILARRVTILPSDDDPVQPQRFL